MDASQNTQFLISLPEKYNSLFILKTLLKQNGDKKMTITKFYEIYESFINGQFKQMRDQINDLPKGFGGYIDLIQWLKETFNAEISLKIVLMMAKLDLA